MIQLCKIDKLVCPKTYRRALWVTLARYTFSKRVEAIETFLRTEVLSDRSKLCNIELSHWYRVDKVFYTPEAKLRCVKITSYITKRS